MSSVDVQAVDQTVKALKMTKADVNLYPETADQSCRPRHQASVNSVSSDAQFLPEFVTRVEPIPGEPEP